MYCMRVSYTLRGKYLIRKFTKKANFNQPENNSNYPQ